MTIPPSAFAGICESNQTSFYYAESSEVDIGYFEKYLIGKRRGTYYIFAVKTVDVNFSRVVNVFQDMKNYPKFMLGFKSITVKRLSDSEILADIHFDAPLSPFVSTFTNEMEIQSNDETYLQCWQQLKEDDPRVIEKYRFAPLRNEGFWHVEKLSDNRTRISYNSVIKPPVWIPKWAYQYFVKNSYVEMFRGIIQRANR